MRAGEIMTRSVATVGPDTPVRHAVELLNERRVTSLPVLDEDGCVVGIVSRRDLLRTLLRDDAAINADVTQRLAEYAGEDDRWRVAVDEGVVTIRGRFDDAAQQEIVTVLARTAPGVVRVHTRRRRLG